MKSHLGIQLGWLLILFLSAPAALAEGGFDPFAVGPYNYPPVINFGQLPTNYGVCLNKCGALPLGSFEYNQCFGHCTSLNSQGGFGHGFGGFGGIADPVSDAGICSQHGGTHIVHRQNVVNFNEPCPASSGFTTVGVLPSGSFCCKHGNSTTTAASNNGGSNGGNGITNTSTNTNGNGSSCNANLALQCLNSGQNMLFCLQFSGCAG